MPEDYLAASDDKMKGLMSRHRTLSDSNVHLVDKLESMSDEVTLYNKMFKLLLHVIISIGKLILLNLKVLGEFLVTFISYKTKIAYCQKSHFFSKDLDLPYLNRLSEVSPKDLQLHWVPF